MVSTRTIFAPTYAHASVNSPGRVQTETEGGKPAKREADFKKKWSEQNKKIESRQEIKNKNSLPRPRSVDENIPDFCATSISCAAQADCSQHELAHFSSPLKHEHQNDGKEQDNLKPRGSKDEEDEDIHHNNNLRLVLGHTELLKAYQDGRNKMKLVMRNDSIEAEEMKPTCQSFLGSSSSGVVKTEARRESTKGEFLEDKKGTSMISENHRAVAFSNRSIFAHTDVHASENSPGQAPTPCFKQTQSDELSAPLILVAEIALSSLDENIPDSPHKRILLNGSEKSFTSCSHSHDSRIFHAATGSQKKLAPDSFLKKRMSHGDDHEEDPLHTNENTIYLLEHMELQKAYQEGRNELKQKLNDFMKSEETKRMSRVRSQSSSSELKQERESLEEFLELEQEACSILAENKDSTNASTAVLPYPSMDPVSRNQTQYAVSADNDINKILQGTYDALALKRKKLLKVRERSYYRKIAPIEKRHNIHREIPTAAPGQHTENYQCELKQKKYIVKYIRLVLVRWAAKDYDGCWSVVADNLAIARPIIDHYDSRNQRLSAYLEFRLSKRLREIDQNRTFVVAQAAAMVESEWSSKSEGMLEKGVASKIILSSEYDLLAEYLSDPQMTATALRWKANRSEKFERMSVLRCLHAAKALEEAIQEKHSTKVSAVRDSIPCIEWANVLAKLSTKKQKALAALATQSR